MFDLFAKFKSKNILIELSNKSFSNHNFISQILEMTNNPALVSN